MKKMMAFLMCVGITNVSYAGSDEIAAAKGIMIASILNEKCTGKAPLPDQAEREVRFLEGQGMDFDDIKTGFGQGILYAEITYPGHTKPPKSECAEAIKLYRELRKHI